MEEKTDMTGAQLKQLGLDLVEINAQTFCETMRSVARGICREQGTVTSDDLRLYARENGIEPHHPNAWGAIFRTGFERVGYENAKTPSAHSRMISRWKLKQ